MDQNIFDIRGRVKNFKEAFPRLKKFARAGDAHAQNLVGYAYDLGKGVPINRKLAVRWYKRSAKQRYPEALANLAIAYALGKGVRRNARRSFSLYKIAADLGDIWSQCNLGVMYADGDGVREDAKKAIYWWRKAARGGATKLSSIWARLTSKVKAIRGTEQERCSGCIRQGRMGTDLPSGS